MLINIEPDADIVDPGTFALMQESYLGFDFNDYPAEVLCPFPTVQQGTFVSLNLLKLCKNR